MASNFDKNPNGCLKIALFFFGFIAIMCTIGFLINGADFVDDFLNEDNTFSLSMLRSGFVLVVIGLLIYLYKRYKANGKE